jgi:hypothetical protein
VRPENVEGSTTSVIETTGKTGQNLCLPKSKSGRSSLRKQIDRSIIKTKRKNLSTLQNPPTWKRPTTQRDKKKRRGNGGNRATLTLKRKWEIKSLMRVKGTSSRIGNTTTNNVRNSVSNLQGSSSPRDTKSTIEKTNKRKVVLRTIKLTTQRKEGSQGPRPVIISQRAAI